MTFFLIILLFIFIIVLFQKQNNMKYEISKQRQEILRLTELIKHLTPMDVSKAEETAAAPVAEPVPPTPEPSICEPIISKPIISEPIIYNSEAGGEPATELPIGSDLPEPVKQPASFNNPAHKPFFKSENWIGIQLLNRIGAFLIIIGAIATAQYQGFPPEVRTLILFLFALGVTGFGEILNRRNPTIVSMGVSAAGVALLYVALAASFFGLHTLGMYTALFGCIIITIIGLYLSIRYEAQVIGTFALIGGYMPIFAFDPYNQTMLYGLIVYFILLHVFSLGIALRRKWTAMNIVGFILTIAGTLYIGWQAEPVIALVYACFGFLLYTALPLIASYRTGERFSETDIALIISNTFISSIIIFLITYRLYNEHIHAYLCLIFAMIYFGLSSMVKRIYDKEVNMQTIFMLTSIAFCVLFVPFFFDKEWFAIAWLTEAVVLAAYGILRERRLPEFCGLTVLGLSGFTLLMHKLLFWLQFTFKYSFFTIGCLVVLGCFIARDKHRSSYGQGYKVLSLINLWVYLMYIIFQHIKNYENVGTLCVIVTFILAAVYVKLPFITDIPTKIVANIMHLSGVLGLLVTTFAYGFRLFGIISINRGGLYFNLLAEIIAFALVIIYMVTEENNAHVLRYKNFSIINLWLSIIWILSILFSNFFGIDMICVILTFVCAFLITRIPLITDNGTRVIAIILDIIGLLCLWGINCSEYYTAFGQMFLNCVTQTVALFALNDLIKLCNKKESPLRIIFLSGYFLLALTQGLMVQADVAFNSAIISILYAIASFAWILLGFKLRNKPVRKFGLQLSIASVAKLLVIDTLGLSTGMRIISYISLGLILMLISFVYQKLSQGIND